MIKKRPKVTAVVPIKKHSERFPQKNFKMLGDWPLYYHVFNTLSQCHLIDSLCLFTSEPFDSFTLPNMVDYIKEDATPSSQGNTAMSIILEICRKKDSDYYLLAHATSPFTSIDSVNKSIFNVVDGKFDSALSVECVKTFAWHKGQPVNYDLTAPPKTQNIEPVFIETSGFYLFSKKLALDYSRRIGFRPFFCEVVFPETIDIDYPWQFKLAELAITHKLQYVMN